MTNDDSPGRCWPHQWRPGFCGATHDARGRAVSHRRRRPRCSSRPQTSVISQTPQRSQMILISQRFQKSQSSLSSQNSQTSLLHRW